MAKLLDLSVYGPGHISNILQVDASVYAKAFVTDGGKDTQVVRGDGTLASISSLSVGNADTVDNKHASDFAAVGHTHSLGNKPASDLSSTYPRGISVGGIYANGYPIDYGCTITSCGNSGYFQIAGEWNANVSSLTDNDKPTEMYIRGRRDSYDVWTTWSRVLTNRNYTSYVNTTNFPGLNKVGTVTSVTVTGANGLSGTGTITSSGTITLSNAGVRSTTINGNYLRVNTNGTNTDLTIPYATNADTLDSYHKNNIYGWSGVSDLNGMTDAFAGIKYFAYGYAEAPSIANQPYGNYANDARGALLFDGVYCPLQLSWQYEGRNIWMRTKYNGSWKNWYKLAFSSDIPTNNNQLTNGAGYITSSGSCAYATSAGNADLLDGQNLITEVSDWNTNSLSIFKSSEYDTPNAPILDYTYGITLRFHRDESLHHTDLVTSLYSDRLFFRRKTDRGYQTWRELIHSGNIGSQSVSYATSAGSAPASDVYAWAKKSSLELVDVPDLSSRYLPLSGGVLSGDLSINNSLTTFSSTTKGGNGVNAGTIIKGINYTHSLWLIDSFHTEPYAVIRGGYKDFAASLILNEFSGENTISKKTVISTGNSYFGGNVGIGITEPQYSLDVNGTFNAMSGYINGNTVYHSGNCNNASTPWSASEIGIGTTERKAKLQINGNHSGIITGDIREIADIAFGYVNDDGVYMGFIGGSSGYGWIQSAYGPSTAAGAKALCLNPVGGKVGIGTTSPAARMEVNCNDNDLIWQEVLRNSNNSGNTGYGVGLKLKLSSDEAPYEVKKWGGIAYIATFNYANRGALAFYSGSANYTPVERMIITDDGNVGIGTTSPSEKLHVIGNITTTGNIYASAFYESSDERLKDFENDVNVDLNLIRSIPKMHFRWKKNPNKLQIGTSAQAVKKIYPELVTSSEDGILSVDYSKLSIVALSAIDKLHLENQELKHEINLLKQEIEKLKGQI